MKATQTSRRAKASAPPASAGRKSRPSRRRGSASSRPKGQAPRRAAARPRSSAKRSAPAKPRKPAQEQAQYVCLPGTLSRRGDGWWWEVKLPGETEPQARPLQPNDADAPAQDLDAAKAVALEMWQRSLAASVERRVKSETSETIARLKARFLEKVRDFSQVVETTKARLEAETQARAEAEAKLAEIGSHAVQTTVCECCGTIGIPTTSTQRIDSGQLLCQDCLAALRAEIERIEAETAPVTP
ncbi:MAG: hypothetical protein JW993_07435 [Sedimentisphaerales bacterium]|nr:hypothetical protein [Sedimentisphaerales bacterium]